MPSNFWYWAERTEGWAAIRSDTRRRRRRAGAHQSHDNVRRSRQLCYHRSHERGRTRALFPADPVPGDRRSGPGGAAPVARRGGGLRRAGKFPRGCPGAGRGRAASPSSTAITSSRATSTASGSSRSPTRPKRCPKPRPPSAASPASIPPSRVRGVVADLTAGNAVELLGGAGVILDGTDNFDTRYLINDFAVSRGIPWIYGAAVGSYGLAHAGASRGARRACAASIRSRPPGVQPTCETAGVLNVIVSAVASLQVADALKILSGRADSVRARITTIDLWEGGIRQIEAPPRDPDCPACGRREFAYLEESRRGPVTLCGRNAVQIHEQARPIDLEAVALTARAAGRGAGQRVRAALSGVPLRDDRVPRRPGDRQRHQRHGGRPESLCAVYRGLAKDIIV